MDLEGGGGREEGEGGREKEWIQYDSIVEVGVKGKYLGLERKTLARRLTTFLATKSGGERRLEKMIRFLVS